MTMQNRGTIRLLSRALTAWILALAGCGSGNNGQTNQSAVTLPDTAIGKYDVVLSGEWIGTSVVTIQSSSAVLQSLHATRDSWVADLPGPYDTKSVTDADGSWHFQWDEQVSTQGALVRQQIEFVVAYEGFTASGFEGQYTHTSDLTGTHGGGLSGKRQ
jgi:hypothetical protein